MRVKNMVRQLRQQMSTKLNTATKCTAHEDDELGMFSSTSRRQEELEADFVRVQTLLNSAPKSLTLSRQTAIDPTRFDGKTCSKCGITSPRRKRLSIISEAVPSSSSHKCSLHRHQSLPVAPHINNTSSSSLSLRKTLLHRRHSSINDIPFAGMSLDRPTNHQSNASDAKLQSMSYVDMNDASMESIFASVEVKRSRSFGSNSSKSKSSSKRPSTQPPTRSLTPNSLNEQDISLYIKAASKQATTSTEPLQRWCSISMFRTHHACSQPELSLVY